MYHPKPKAATVNDTNKNEQLNEMYFTQDATSLSKTNVTDFGKN